MKMLIFLAALLLAAPSSAHLWTENCTPSNPICTAAGFPFSCCTGVGTGDCPNNSTIASDDVLGKTTLRALDRACWFFDSADGNGLAGNSPVFRTAADMRICINDDILATAAPTTVAVDIRRCPTGERTAATPGFPCSSIEAALIDNLCFTVTPGTFFFDPSAACVAGDVCMISIEGADPQRQ